MKSFTAVAALAAMATQSVLADTQLITESSEMEALCPTLDGNSVTSSGGTKYSVSCDWTMEAEGKTIKVEGKTSPLICMEACEETEDCYSVNIDAEGGCNLISGKEKGMTTSAGFINLFRLPQASGTAAPQLPVQITTTRSAPTSSSVSSDIIANPSMPTPGAISESCNSNRFNICPGCNDTVVKDESGKEYHVFCDRSLFTEGTYSVQEFLSWEGCLEVCDGFSWCLGTSYSAERGSCEIARGPVVYPVVENEYAAFLPVASSADTVTARPSTLSAVRTSFQASNGSITANKTTSSTVPDSTASILPINSGCDVSSLTCPVCDGIAVDDTLDQTYTALCSFDPVCDSTAIVDGPVSQDECMLECDQDATCLAVLWYTDRNACHLCQQGLDGGPGQSSDFVLLVADIDGDEDDSPSSTSYTTSTSTRNSSTTSPPGTPSASNTKSLLPPAPFSSKLALSTASSPKPTVYASPAPTTGPMASFTPSETFSSGGPYANATRSASVPDVSAVVCPGLGKGVFVDPTDFNFFMVLCDSIVTAANSRYTSASNFAACVALCTADCDAVQFGYSTRCGLHQDMSIVGPGIGWTVAASLTFPESTTLPFSTIAATTLSTITSNVEATPVPRKRAAHVY